MKDLQEGSIFRVENGKLVEKPHSALVDLRECAAYIVKQLRLTKLLPKSHGQDILIWRNNEVLDVDRSQRLRVDGQEFIS